MSCHNSHDGFFLWSLKSSFIMFFSPLWTPSVIILYELVVYPKCSKWQIANVNVHRARSCVGNGTLCSKTMAPNGRWKTQLDIRWRPRPSASWFPLLTLRGWPLLIGEFAQNRVCEQLFKHSADLSLCCALAAWPASKLKSSRKWQTARKFCWNILMSWKRVGQEQVQTKIKMKKAT